MNRIAIVGAGAWGTALAHLAAHGGETLLWTRNPALVEAIEHRRENAAYLPGVKLHPFVRPTADLAHLAAASLWCLVTPAQHMRAILQAAAPHWHGQPVLLCSKGIEAASGALMTEVAAATLPAAALAVLSGPTFAAEVAAGQPTAVAIASHDRALADEVAARLGRATFRPYVGGDIVGAEVGGAVKNVLAIACGAALGAGFGDNARAALITRGLAEMTRFGMALGGRPETFMGLAGVGDLVLTCSSPQSRNMSLGAALGRGQSLDQALADRHTVAEGVATAPAVLRRARATGVEMPICAAVNHVLDGASVAEAMAALLARPWRGQETGV